MPTRDSILEKARRLAVAERIGTRVFNVVGDHGTYYVVMERDESDEAGWRPAACTCPSLIACSHMGAAYLAVLRGSGFDPAHSADH